MRDAADAERIQGWSGFELDLKDVGAMVESGLVEPGRLLDLYEGIEPELYRFPAVDPSSLRAAVEALVAVD